MKLFLFFYQPFLNHNQNLKQKSIEVVEKNLILKDMLKLIKLNDKYFVPPISQRVSLEGYLEYLLGKNNIYIKSKYGPNTPLPKNPFTLCVQNSDKNHYKTIGFISCFEYFKPFDGGYIVTIMTDPEFRNNGIGTFLFSKALNQFKKKGVRKVSVTTWSTNKISQRIFKKFGFKLEKIVPEERAPSIDGFYFVKRI